MALPAGARFATFVDGKPVLASMEEVRAAAGVTDLASRIDDATAEARDRLAAVAGVNADGARTVQDQIVQAHQTIEAVQADVDAVVGEAVPRIDNAIAEAGQRIDSARADLTAERQRAIGAEEVLAERITIVEAGAGGSGYDDAAIYARVGEVDRARADGDRALGERIDTVQSSYARGVTTNPDFGQGKAGWSAIDWTVVDGAGGGRLLRSTAGAYNVLQGAGLFKLVDLGRAFRLHCTFRLVGAPQLTYVGLTVFDAAGTAIGNVYADGFVNVRAPGTYEVSQLYQGVNALLPNPTYTEGGKFPSGAAFASPLFLANYPNPSSPVPGGYAEVLAFWLEDVTEALRVDARVTTEAVTLAAADRAIAERVATTEAQFRGEQGSVLLSRLSATETATTDGRFATAQRATTIETSLNDARGRLNSVETATTDGRFAAAGRVGGLEVAVAASGTAENANPEFAAWPDGQALPTGWAPWAASGPCARVGATLGGGGWAAERVPSDIDAGMVVPDVYLTEGWHIIRVKAWRTRGSWNGGGATWGGIANVDFMADKDLAGKVGDNDSGGVREWAKPVYIDAQWVGYRAWHAMDNWAGFGRGFSDKTLRWFRCGIYRASDAEVKAILADQVLNAPGGVLARLTASDAALADLPNRYAAVSRTAALEAQVNFAADSGLQRTINARIEDRAATIADAKAGAVSQTVAQLRSEYNGTAATVSQQAGTIADVNYRTRAYWRAIADAGNNRAAVTIYADSNNGAGVNIVGDVGIDGNLTLSGTLKTRTLEPNAVSASTALGGLNVQGGDDTLSVTTLSSGGAMRVDLQMDGLRTGGNGDCTVQLWIDAGGGPYAATRKVNFSPSRFSSPVSFFYVNSFPAGAQVTAWLRTEVTSGTWFCSGGAIAITELKR